MSSSGHNKSAKASGRRPGNASRQKPGRKRSKKKKNKLQQQEITVEVTPPPAQASVSQEKDFGDLFGEKPVGVICLSGVNADLLNAANFNNEKGNEAHQLARVFEIDGLCGQEPGLSWDLAPHSGRLEPVL